MVIVGKAGLTLAMGDEVKGRTLTPIGVVYHMTARYLSIFAAG